MEVSYSLECGHAYRYRRHVELRDGKRWCRRCKDHKKVTHIGVTPRIKPFLHMRKKKT